MADEILWIRNGKLVINSEGKPIYCDHCTCNDDEPEIPELPEGAMLFADIVLTTDFSDSLMDVREPLLMVRLDQSGHPIYEHGENYEGWAVWDLYPKYYITVNGNFLTNLNSRSLTVGVLSSTKDNSTMTITFRVDSSHNFIVKTCPVQGVQHTTEVSGYQLSSDSSGYYFIDMLLSVYQPRHEMYYPFYSIPIAYYTIPVSLEDGSAQVDVVKEDQRNSIHVYQVSGSFNDAGHFSTLAFNNGNITSTLTIPFDNVKMKKIGSIDISNVGDIVPTDTNLSSSLSSTVTIGTYQYTELPTHTHDTSILSNYVEGRAVNAKLWATKDYYLERLVTGLPFGYVWSESRNWNIFSSQFYVRYENSNYIGKDDTFTVDSESRNLIFFNYWYDDYFGSTNLIPEIYKSNIDRFTYENERIEATDLESTSVKVESDNEWYYHNVYTKKNPPFTGYVTDRLYFIAPSSYETGANFLNSFNATYQISYYSQQYSSGKYKIKLTSNSSLSDYIYVYTNGEGVDDIRVDTVNKKLLVDVIVLFDFLKQQYYFDNLIGIDNSLVEATETGVHYIPGSGWFTRISHHVENSGEWLYFMNEINNLLVYPDTSPFDSDGSINARFTENSAGRITGITNGSTTIPLTPSTFYDWDGTTVLTAYYLTFNNVIYYYVTETNLPLKDKLLFNDHTLIYDGITYRHSFYREGEAESFRGNIPSLGYQNVLCFPNDATSIYVGETYISPDKLSGCIYHYRYYTLDSTLLNNYTYEEDDNYNHYIPINYNVTYDTKINRYYFVPSSPVNAVHNNLILPCKYFILNYGQSSGWLDNYIYLENKKYGILRDGEHSFDDNYRDRKTRCLDTLGYSDESATNTVEILEILDSNENITGLRAKVISGNSIQTYTCTTGWFVNYHDRINPVTHVSNDIWRVNYWNSSASDEETFTMTGTTTTPPPYFWVPNGHNLYCNIFSCYYFEKDDPDYAYFVYKRYYDYLYGYIINTIAHFYSTSVDGNNWTDFKIAGNIERYKDISPYLCYRANYYGVGKFNRTITNTNNFVIPDGTYLSALYYDETLMNINSHIDAGDTTYTPQPDYENKNRAFRRNNEPAELHCWTGSNEAQIHTITLYIDTNKFHLNGVPDEDFIDSTLALNAERYNGCICLIITGFKFEFRQGSTMSTPETYEERGEPLTAHLALSTTYAISYNFTNLQLLTGYSSLTNFTRYFGNTFTVDKCRALSGNNDKFSVNFLTHVRPLKMTVEAGTDFANFILPIPYILNWKNYDQYNVGAYLKWQEGYDPRATTP